MSDARLMNQLNVVASRLRRLRAVKASLACWTIIAVSLLLLTLQDAPRSTLILFLAGGIVSSILFSLWYGRSRPTDRTTAAMEIENEFPELDAMLLTCIQQKPSSDRWEYNFLQSELATKVLEHSRINNWSEAVYGLNHYRLSRIFAMLTCLLLIIYAAPQLTSPVQNELAPVVAEVPASHAAKIVVSVEPGDTEVERGTSLLVLARFDEKLPADVTLVATDKESRQVRIPLNKSLDDPIYGGRISNIDQDLTYHIEFDTEKSDDYAVTTFTYPELLKADAEINFPEYTELEPENLEDVRRLTVVEGSEINYEFLLSKELKSATLIDEQGERLELITSDADQLKRTVAWKTSQPAKRKYQLELVDLQGRKNRDAPEFIVQVLPNLPARLKVEFPSRDMRVSPIEELFLQANATDDYGLVDYGIVYEKPTGEQAEINLKGESEKSKKSEMDHLLAVETLKVEPEQLISYYFYADDIGPDGKQRRAFSDIFFSEVRHFEEIYREVPAPPSQQQQQQQQGTESGKLLEVQRQIVTATWNLIRSESRTEPSEKFLDSAQVLFESQEQALTMAEEMMQRIQDDEMKLHLNEAMVLMTSTSRYFAESIARQKLESLHDARSKAQAAYQALLKLNSREKQVQQQQQSQSQSSQSRQQDRNRQLKALELKNDRDRYETERQAQQQQQEEKRETLQVLNRLRELARRQEDLNEKIRELENKLREAETEEEKAELERELKRLQEEQEELLRNLDEVQERMNREENRERMADAREQVEQTRERVLRASEALKEQQTSRALTEGTRAERELNDLKEDFKNQSSSQFEEAVRNLRDDVRELAKDQESVAEAMQGEAQAKQENQRPSLRPDEPAENREDIAKALEQQKERLSEILDRTKELVQESEATEPLLSQKLYETMRDLRKFEPEESLKNAAQLQRYGIEEEARKTEEQARQGIQRLQTGVDDAAESILGDEGEALAAASQVLDELTEAIKNELRANPENSPSSENNQNPSESQTGENSQSEGKPEENAQRQTGSAENPDQQQQSASEEGNPAQDAQQNSQKGSPQKSNQPGQSQPESDQESSQRGSPMPGEPQSDNPQKGESNSESQNSQQSQDSQSPNGQGQSQSDQQSESNQQSQSPGQQQGQRSNSQSQPSPGQQGSAQQNSGQDSQNQQGNRPGERPNLGQRLGNLFQENGSEQGGASAGRGNRRLSMPLTGDEYREWSDQMRDLEEMVPSTELRSQVATIRERARQMRIDLKRHSKAPDMELVQTSIYGPMVELQQVIAEELARRNPNEKLVPIDRDPVPDKYTELLQKYYEELARQRTDRD